MSDHNSPYSAGMIKGVLTDMVVCIKELLLDGKSVKIDDLAIFSVGLRGTSVDDPCRLLRGRERDRATPQGTRHRQPLHHQPEAGQQAEAPGRVCETGASDGGSTPTDPDEEEEGGKPANGVAYFSFCVKTKRKVHSNNNLKPLSYDRQPEQKAQVGMGHCIESDYLCGHRTLR